MSATRPRRWPARATRGLSPCCGGGFAVTSACRRTVLWWRRYAPTGLLALAGSLARNPPPAAEARRLWYRAKALEMLSAFVQLLSQPEALNGPAAQERQRLHEACDLLRARHAEHWPPGLLARTVGLSEKRLQQLMRESTGQSVHAYLSDVRLARACDLLQAGMSVTQVAGEVGISSLSHFSKVFKARYGVSPRSW